MNDDIKEILREMKQMCDVWVKVDGNMKSYNQDQIHKIYEYITNLQQENERLKWDKEQLNGLVNSCQNVIRKLKSKIKHAVDFINKHKKEITKEDTTIFNEDREDKSKLKVGTFMWHVDDLLDILNVRSDE